ncbi:MAG: cupin domain-containing protein [Gammaproteobacteria bacterium]
MPALSKSILLALITFVGSTGCAPTEQATEAEPATEAAQMTEAEPATEAEPVTEAGPVTEAESVYVVVGADRAATPVAAWGEGDAVRAASGSGVEGAPSDAVRYEAKIVQWPTAAVKVLTFSEATGGVLHPLTDETLIYVLEGQLETTVGGESVALDTGDVASLPEGSLHNAAAAADAVVVAWTAPGLTPGATPAVVRQADVEQAVLGGGGLKLRRYEFPGNSVRAVELGKGFGTNTASAKTDSLIYITKGPLQFFQNGQEFTVTKGDFIREIAGAEHNWDVTEESGFVTTSALPVGAESIDPDQATDRPE